MKIYVDRYIYSKHTCTFSNWISLIYFFFLIDKRDVFYIDSPYKITNLPRTTHTWLDIIMHNWYTQKIEYNWIFYLTILSIKINFFWTSFWQKNNKKLIFPRDFLHFFTFICNTNSDIRRTIYEYDIQMTTTKTITFN